MCGITTQQSASQFNSLKIRRSPIDYCMKFDDLRLLRLWNCERVVRVNRFAFKTRIQFPPQPLAKAFFIFLPIHTYTYNCYSFFLLSLSPLFKSIRLRLKFRAPLVSSETLYNGVKYNLGLATARLLYLLCIRSRDPSSSSRMYLN